MKQKRKRYSKRNRHHIIPKARGGKATTQNLLLMDIDKHNELHRIFGLMTLDEIIALLIRVRRAKQNQRD